MHVRGRRKESLREIVHKDTTTLKGESNGAVVYKGHV
jgi:hypothetical protein